MGHLQYTSHIQYVQYVGLRTVHPSSNTAPRLPAACSVSPPVCRAGPVVRCEGGTSLFVLV